MIGVGLLGHGIVGGGVAEILQSERDRIELSCGRRVDIARILDVRSFSDSQYAQLFTSDADSFFETPGMSVVAECMGGVGHSYAYVKQALKRRMHVVSSNKELVALHGEELMELANANGVGFYFEASSGGGIPIISALRNSMLADTIERIHGILNGTTNYMLTRMSDGGVDYDEALREARSHGYAERDPSADVLGLDARRKLNILASVAFGAALNDTLIPTTGITGVTREAMAYAHHLGRSIKWVASALNMGDSWTGRVAPVMLPASHTLAAVNDVNNAILIHGDRVGDLVFSGRGAGRYPTASAVCADIIEAAKHIDAPHPTPKRPRLAFVPMDISTRYFIRVRSGDAAVKEKAEALFADALIVTLDNTAYANEFALVTPEIKQNALEERLEALTLGANVDEPILYQGA